MDYAIIPDEQALGKCTWCRKQITEESEVFGMGVKLKPGVNLSEYEGHCVQIDLTSREKAVSMLVPMQGSEAREEGNDGIFLLCSKACGNQLKATLEGEVALGKTFGRVHFTHQ